MWLKTCLEANFDLRSYFSITNKRIDKKKTGFLFSDPSGKISKNTYLFNPIKLENFVIFDKI